MSRLGIKSQLNSVCPSPPDIRPATVAWVMFLARHFTWRENYIHLPQFDSRIRIALIFIFYWREEEVENNDMIDKIIQIK
jgi:hypothetical protein